MYNNTKVIKIIYNVYIRVKIMNKKKVGIFYSSDTGNTEKIAKMIHTQIGKKISDISEISNCIKTDIEYYNKLIFGIPTWYYGEPQCDWDSFLPTLKKINFSGKDIAIFGCGDQEDYSEYFCNAMYILYKITLRNGGNIVGFWPTSGYHFNKSKSVINNGLFVGLAIDEDRQPNMTLTRIQSWVKQICYEMKLNIK